MFGLFKSKNDEGKAKAAPPKANQQPATNQKDTVPLQQLLGNRAIANRAKQTSTTPQEALPSPEQMMQEELDLSTMLIDERAVDALYTNKLYEPLKLAALMKFGVGRGEWRRSKELNAFRQTMKDAARAQANEDITNQIENHASMQEKSTLGQAFYGMLAKKEAHSLSKGSVDAVMEKEAEKVVNTVLPAASAKQQLKLAAHNSAYQLAALQQNTDKKIRQAALKGAQIKAIELLKHSESLVVNEARKMIKGSKYLEGSTPDLERQNQLKSAVKTQVTLDNIADTAIKQAIETDSLTSGLAKIGTVIDLAVPNNGDSGTFEFELKIPVGQSGVYCIISFGAEAERDDGELTVGAQIGLGAGFKTFGIDGNFQVGLFIESKAGNSTSVMNLISYGMYRHMRILSPSAAEYFWSQDGKSGMSKLDEAELWAAMIEAQDMEGDNYVDIGTFKQLSAELETRVVNAELSLGKKKFTHFDRDAIAALTFNGVGEDTDLNLLKWKANRISQLKQKRVYEASGELELDLGFGSLSLAAEGSATYFNNRRESIEVSIGASIPFQYGEEMADWVTTMSKFTMPTLGLLTNISNALIRHNKNAQQDPSGNQSAAHEEENEKDDHNVGLRNAGTALDVGSDVMFLVPQFDKIGKSLAEQIQEKSEITGKIENKIGLSSQTSVTFHFEKEWDRLGRPTDWKISLELGQTKSFEVDAGIVSFSVEKTKKLIEIGREKKDGEKKFVGSALGLG